MYILYYPIGGGIDGVDTAPTLTDCLWLLRTALKVVLRTQRIRNCTRWFLLSDSRVASFLDLASLEPVMSVWCQRAQCCQSSEFPQSYGIILWGNSSHSYSVQCKMQKRVLRIMTKSGYRDSCRQLFKIWGILPFYSQYIVSLMLFVVRNTHFYIANQETHGVNTRHNTDFHFPKVRLTAFKEGAYFMGMKIFNHLPTNIKIL
jgi:hypothetical protein